MTDPFRLLFIDTMLNRNAFQKDTYCLLQWLSLLPCMSPPCHTCPLPYTPPPIMHAPIHHACPPPFTMHAPLHHACPPPLPHMPPFCHVCPPVDRRMIHACQNITFPQLLLRTVTITDRYFFQKRYV